MSENLLGVYGVPVSYCWSCDHHVTITCIVPQSIVIRVVGQEINCHQGHKVSWFTFSLFFGVESHFFCRDFSWSPTDHMIAYWVPDRDSIPAKITIIGIPSRKDICTKSRHDVSEVCGACGCGVSMKRALSSLSPPPLSHPPPPLSHSVSSSGTNRGTTCV